MAHDVIHNVKKGGMLLLQQHSGPMLALYHPPCSMLQAHQGSALSMLTGPTHTKRGQRIRLTAPAKCCLECRPDPALKFTLLRQPRVFAFGSLNAMRHSDRSMMPTRSHDAYLGGVRIRVLFYTCVAPFF